ncbi:MAG: hypothetical protein ACYC1D_05210 [Acidimicrobiales bacterium]
MIRRARSPVGSAPPWRRSQDAGTDVGGTEAGFAGGAEGLIFGMLIFVAGTLLVANAWAVIDTKLAAAVAAREAARTYVEAPDAATASAEADQAAAGALNGFGRNPALGRVTLVSGTWGRCQRITIQVRYPAPLLVLPFIGRVGAAESVTADQSELVDPFRSGLPGTASCS